MFRIVKTSDPRYAAAVYRGVNMVEGKGKVWNTRHGIVNAVSSTIIGAYRGVYSNNVCFDDLSIHDVMSNTFTPVKDFLNEKELDKTKKEIIGNEVSHLFHKFIRLKRGDFDRIWDIPVTEKDELFKEYMVIMNAKWRTIGLKDFNFSV